MPWWLAVMAGLLAGPSRAAGTATDPTSATPMNDPPVVQTLPVHLTLGFESLRLPDGERMGLLGTSYLIELAPGWWLGPALYGAAAGQRGGLFTWGVEGQRRWPLSERWALVAGLYAGGGGGGGAPVGGGLMLRPHADLMFDFGGWEAGITASQVRFPSGAIRSVQLGVLVAVQDEFVFTAPGHAGESVRFTGVGGIGANRMSAAVGRYASASRGGHSVDYVGIRLERQLGQTLSATFSAAGAAKGGADGYAEATAGVLALWPIGGEAIRLGAHAALGLGGGGAVPTGAGPIARLGLAGRWQLSHPLSLEIEAGQARAFGGDFNSRYAQLSLGVVLGGAPISADPDDSRKTLHDTTWALSAQRYAHARRKDGSTHSLGTLGFKFTRSVSEHLYLSGQAHSAITGGAGAYSVGLIGMGVSTRLGPSTPWKVGAEAMAGAAGGGGVAIRGGAMAQPMAWIGRDLGRFSRITFGAGYVRAVRGELSSPVIDVSWGATFGTP